MHNGTAVRGTGQYRCVRHLARLASLPTAWAFRRMFPDGGDTSVRLVRRVSEWLFSRMSFPLFLLLLTKRLPSKNQTRYLTQLLASPFTLTSNLYSDPGLCTPSPSYLAQCSYASHFYHPRPCVCTADTSRRICNNSYSTTREAAREREKS